MEWRGATTTATATAVGLAVDQAITVVEPPLAPVSSVGEWGLTAVALLLLATSLVALRRRTVA
jgi:hypothetical protein